MTNGRGDMMEEQILCTILVVAYKHEKYIGRALDSILSQKTDYRYKINIFDDASPDGTGEIIEGYASRYPNKINVFRAEKNMGAQANIWRALESVDTRYFMILEGDDYWCNDHKLQLQISVMEKHPECSFCGHNSYLISLDETSREYEENSLCCTQKFLKTKNIFKYKDFVRKTEGGYIPYVSSRLIRSSAIDLKEIKYKESVLFDFTQFYYLLLKGNYYYIDMPMTVYQRTGAGVCSGITPVEFLNTFIQNAIDFNKQTNNIIADKIFSECMLQADFRLQLYKSNYIKRPFKIRTGKSGEMKERMDKSDIKQSIVLKEEFFSEEKYYYLCNAGIGFTVIVCALKPELEKLRGASICLLIQEEHKFIPKLYGIEDYILVDTEGLDLESLSDRYPNPTKGKIYVVHPFAHKEESLYYAPIHGLYSTERFLPWLYRFFGLDEDTELKYPDRLPELSPKSLKKVKRIGDLSKTVLFLPEAMTIDCVSERYWADIASELKEQGLRVISAPKARHYTVKGTRFEDLSAEEITYVGMKCHSVYATRNGFCELLASRGRDLHVIYPSHNTHFIYSFNKPGMPVFINEKIELSLSKFSKGDSRDASRVVPKLFGIIRIPDFVYSFYYKRKSFFKNQKLIRFFVKWK